MTKCPHLKAIESLHLIDDPNGSFPVVGEQYPSSIQKLIDIEKAKSPSRRLLESLNPEAKPLLFLSDKIYLLPEQNAKAITRALRLEEEINSESLDALYVETIVFGIPPSGKIKRDRIQPFIVEIWRACADIGPYTVVSITPFNADPLICDRKVEKRRSQRKKKVIDAIAPHLNLAGLAEPRAIREFAETRDAASAHMVQRRRANKQIESEEECAFVKVVNEALLEFEREYLEVELSLAFQAPDG